MPEKINLSTPAENPHTPDRSLMKADDAVLKLESVLKACYEKSLKGSAMIRLAESEGIKISYRSLLTKLYNYKKDGIKSLLKKQRKDKGEMISFSNSALHKLQELYFSSQCGIRAYEDMHKWLRSISIEFSPDKVNHVYKIHNSQLYQIESGTTVMMLSAEFVPGEYVTTDGECLRVGSYASASRYLSGIKKNNGDELHFARFGVSSYRLKRQHSIYLDYSSLGPNDLWSADNKQADIIVIDWDWRSVFRPWLSGFIQVPTRKYCYEISRSANSESVCNGFAIAVEKWGLPKEINHDRGKDYLSDRLQKMFSSLNIKTRRSISRNARAKLIESFHNVLDHKLKNQPGYTGNKYQEMPEETKIMLKEFTKAGRMFSNIEKNVYDSEFRVTLNSNLEGKIRSSKKRFLHISEFIKVLNFALAEYEETLHGGLKTDKLGVKVYDRTCTDEMICKYSERLNTPKGRYDYCVETGYMPTSVDPGVVSVFAMNNEMRSVSQKGIRFRNNHYFSPKLKPFIGRNILIKFNEASDQYVYVFSSDELQKIDPDNFRKTAGSDIINRLEFICLAEKIKIYDYGDTGYTEQIAEQRAEERRLQLATKVTRVTGFEANIHEINKEVEEVLEKTKSKNNKLKSAWDD